jgi:hypothetical protein
MKLDYELLKESHFKVGLDCFRTRPGVNNNLIKKKSAIYTATFVPLFFAQLLAYRVGSGLSPTATAEVTIKIEDINDNPPVFSQRRYFAQVPEDAKTGTQIIQVSCS